MQILRVRMGVLGCAAVLNIDYFRSDDACANLSRMYQKVLSSGQVEGMTKHTRLTEARKELASRPSVSPLHRPTRRRVSRPPLPKKTGQRTGRKGRMLSRRRRTRAALTAHRAHREEPTSRWVGGWVGGWE